MENFDVISQDHMRIGDRALWVYGGDTDFGTISKINRKTICAESSNKYAEPVSVDKSLIYKVIRFHTQAEE